MGSTETVEKLFERCGLSSQAAKSLYTLIGAQPEENSDVIARILPEELEEAMKEWSVGEARASLVDRSRARWALDLARPVASGERGGQSGARTSTNLPAAYERKVYIMRGMPGSGKSTLARSALRAHLESSGVLGGFERMPWLARGFIFSNDDFFETIDPTTGKPVGVNYGLIDPIVGKSAKAKNRLRCELAMELGMTPLLVDNGNTALWEMQEYVQLAQLHGYAVEILDAIKQQPGLTLEAVKGRAKERAAADGKVIPEAGIEFTWQRYESNPLPDDAKAAVAEILKASPPPPPPPVKE